MMAAASKQGFKTSVRLQQSLAMAFYILCFAQLRQERAGFATLAYH
jgi:hypothetical protein